MPWSLINLSQGNFTFLNYDWGFFRCIHTAVRMSGVEAIRIERFVFMSVATADDRLMLRVADSSTFM
jgi:hypothetical protein